MSEASELRETVNSLCIDFCRLESDIFDANDRIEKLRSKIRSLIIGW
jgi:hypothetical protein